MKIYGDYLIRNQEVKDIVEIIKTCIAMDKNSSFSIEGEWGCGKTWILDKVEKSIKGMNLSVEKTPKKYDSNYLVIKYNAWEKDYYEEPLLAIMITLINQINDEIMLNDIITAEIKTLYNQTKDILEDALKSMSKKLIGIDVIEIAKRSKEIYEDFKGNLKKELTANYLENVEKDIKTVITALNNVSKSMPIVFIVDEIDRCLPNYSIKTLERLHHIFGKVQHSVTVIAVNDKQLRNNVEKMFGKEVSYESYVRKFFDFRLKLSVGEGEIEAINITLKPYFDLFSNEGDASLCDDILSNLCKNMSARDFERVYTNAMICHGLVNQDTSIFSKECLVGEILLFACKIACEKEKNRHNIYPNTGNNPISNLGVYVKKLLKKSLLKTKLNLNSSIDVILYIVLEGLELIGKPNMPYIVDENKDKQEIFYFYKEFARYTRLMSI
ncbi:MAG: hypothetical protein IJ359_02660 [Erysipelotrichaceae bacterium]|nr:hypothetical protein [Erysipelotrichaceae bacterium]